MLARNAVVFYRRGGFYFGTRRAIGGTLSIDLGCAARVDLRRVAPRGRE
jgi:hypothetical protein